jgi:N6-L-threonylcarbamoyladenine synthase
VHALYGGVVPEIASRQHLRPSTTSWRRAARGGVDAGDIDVVAATAGPASSARCSSA